eukprot:TRINITY_DN954_c0_g1_i1.p1 TRINITY_DN954_c0_g1~~TRINITY_DN954_c0_g1_i1.p1  ORF type:complete len:559 (-),score=101.76 TRINITY_DN954_c0_g1_i1:921-2597(-)
MQKAEAVYGKPGMLRQGSNVALRRTSTFAASPVTRRESLRIQPTTTRRSSIRTSQPKTSEIEVKAALVQLSDSQPFTEEHFQQFNLLPSHTLMKRLFKAVLFSQNKKNVAGHEAHKPVAKERLLRRLDEFLAEETPCPYLYPEDHPMGIPAVTIDAPSTIATDGGDSTAAPALGRRRTSLTQLRAERRAAQLHPGIDNCTCRQHVYECWATVAREHLSVGIDPADISAAVDWGCAHVRQLPPRGVLAATNVLACIKEICAKVGEKSRLGAHALEVTNLQPIMELVFTACVPRMFLCEHVVWHHLFMMPFAAPDRIDVIALQRRLSDHMMRTDVYGALLQLGRLCLRPDIKDASEKRLWCMEQIRDFLRISPPSELMQHELSIGVEKLVTSDSSDAELSVLAQIQARLTHPTFTVDAPPFIFNWSDNRQALSIADVVLIADAAVMALFNGRPLPDSIEMTCPPGVLTMSALSIEWRSAVGADDTETIGELSVNYELVQQYTIMRMGSQGAKLGSTLALQRDLTQYALCVHTSDVRLFANRFIIWTNNGCWCCLLYLGCL